MLVNCVIYNDGSHREISDKEVRADRTIVLRHGERMIFGKDRNKGLVLVNKELKVVTIGEGGVTEDDILVHDAHTADMGMHSMLIDMKWPEYPESSATCLTRPTTTTSATSWRKSGPSRPSTTWTSCCTADRHGK